MKLFLRLAFLLAFSVSPAAANDGSGPKGKVVLVEIGSKNCMPCRMMAPDLKNLAAHYKNKAEIRTIDIIKNPSERKKYDAYAMPTLIFYDKNGDERLRREGFMEKKEIQGVIDKLLAE